MCLKGVRSLPPRATKGFGSVVAVHRRCGCHSLRYHDSVGAPRLSGSSPGRWRRLGHRHGDFFLHRPTGYRAIEHCHRCKVDDLGLFRSRRLKWACWELRPKDVGFHTGHDCVVPIVVLALVIYGRAKKA